MDDVVNGFIREKQYRCSSIYKEVDIVPFTHNQMMAVQKKRNIYSESLPKQRNLNDKNSKRSYVRLIEANFKKGDYRVDTSYGKEHLPATRERAEKNARNYMKRIANACKKKGFPTPKYVIVTSTTSSKDFESECNTHHHIFLKCELTRDEIEDLWCIRRKKGQKKGDSLGRCNAIKLQPNEKGISEAIHYVAKQLGTHDPKKPSRVTRRWSPSNGLKRIRITEKDRDDKVYSRRQINTLCKDNEKVKNVKYWERKYPGWTIVDPTYDILPVGNDDTGWSIYLKLRKKE